MSKMQIFRDEQGLLRVGVAIESVNAVLPDAKAAEQHRCAKLVAEVAANLRKLQETDGRESYRYAAETVESLLVKILKP